MKNLLFLILIAILAAGCNTQTPPPQEPVRDGLFLHISEGGDDPEDAHEVLMAIKMATIMAADKDVLVYLDIDAVNLVVKGAADVTHEEFESFQTYLAKLKELGVTVCACPTCLKVAGHSPENLMDGVTLADKDKFFSFTKGRILSLDY